MPDDMSRPLIQGQSHGADSKPLEASLSEPGSVMHRALLQGTLAPRLCSPKKLR
ncbi:unnamed protein product [Ophioblennius macclurei]